MDIEELSTTQIILLALLVSFVTSIATGIVTVSLVAQAPPAVTNTVNQVIERTIETVLPGAPGEKTTVKETTVIVKEEDLITNSISQALSNTGRVHQGLATSSPVVGLAVGLNSGLLLTASAVVDKEHLVSFKGKEGVFSVRDRIPGLGIAILSPKGTSTPEVSGFRIGDTTALKLGQTVIGLVSVSAERVAIGAVSAKSQLGEVSREGSDPFAVRAVETNITASLIPGAPLVNIFGDVIGVYTPASEAKGQGSFVAVSDLASLLRVSSVASSTQAQAR